MKTNKKKLEFLKDKYDRLCLWSSNYKLIDKVEKQIEDLEIQIDREDKIDKILN